LVFYYGPTIGSLLEDLLVFHHNLTIEGLLVFHYSPAIGSLLEAPLEALAVLVPVAFVFATFIVLEGAYLYLVLVFVVFIVLLV
jgi:hypothetical protein